MSSSFIHPEIVMPVLNLNGTSKHALLELQLEALSALHKARSAMAMAAPHGRDYQTAPEGTWLAAVRQHRARMELVMKLENEITAIAEAISDQNTGRN